MNTIWVVFGTTGEYSDRDEWPVRAFYSKSNAERLVAAATARANEIFASEEYQSGVNPYDPEMKMDYTGTTYYVVEVPIADDSFFAACEGVIA